MSIVKVVFSSVNEIFVFPKLTSVYVFDKLAMALFNATIIELFV